MENETYMEHIRNMAEKMAHNTIVSFEELPRYDLFLSQVIDYLNDKFEGEGYTSNIVQNYIKGDVISKPEAGKKRGYTKQHLAQLSLLSYMRPILTTEEIKKVFGLAFNDANIVEDDIISWQDTYEIFSEIQKDSFDSLLQKPLFDKSKLSELIKERNLSPEEEKRIITFLIVITLSSQACAIKKLVQAIVDECQDW